MAEAMSGAELATKADLLAVKADLTHEIGLVRSDLEREIGLVRAGLEREIGHVRTDMTALETRLTVVITKLGSDIEILRRDVTIRLGSASIASTGMILAAMHIMLAHQ